MMNIEITVQEPLSRETIDELIKTFDGSNISTNPGEKGWWSNRTEIGVPSHKDNVHKGPDGTIYLDGADFTEGRWSTHLDISGDGKTVNVDLQHNAYSIKEVLDKKGIVYQAKEILNMIYQSRRHKAIFGTED